MPNGLSVIVPLLNEIAGLAELVAELDKLGAEQAIIVDGGSMDGSYQWLQKNWQCSDEQRCLIATQAGRALQMNAGAKLATQEVLLFLHADTQLPEMAKEVICAQANKDKLWGRFDLSFSSNIKMMRVIAFFINLRSRISCIATGDQAIFISRNLFNRVKGYDEIELMEDVAMCRKLKRLAKPVCLKSTIVTSARRWEQNGVFVTIARMWWYRLIFFIGVSPAKFKKGYRDIR